MKPPPGSHLGDGVAPGCLVLSLNPLYEDETIGWDPALLGGWQDVDDKSSMEIERGEWKSYRIKYVHPIETGTLTGYLTAIGDDRFLDVMPARGEDRGSFLAARARRTAPPSRRRSSGADAALVRLDERSAARRHAAPG